MKEFILLIRNQKNALDDLPPERVQEHIKKVGEYISRMLAKEVMLDAQPLAMEGRIVSYSKGNFTDGPFIETKEVISGYYTILADSIDDAVNIAKEDPRFQDGKWSIEVRPILKIEGINQ